MFSLTKRKARFNVTAARVGTTKTDKHIQILYKYDICYVVYMHCATDPSEQLS